MPIGSKTCDMCAVTGAVAPVRQPQPWQPPKDAAGPSELASAAASWAAAPGAMAMPSMPTQLLKAQKQVRSAWRFVAIIGTLILALGLAAELGNVTTLLRFFDWVSVGEGVVFLLLAHFIRAGSVAAAVIVAAIYILDTLAMLFIGHFLAPRVFVILFLLRAVGSAHLLKQQRRKLAAQDLSQAA